MKWWADLKLWWHKADQVKSYSLAKRRGVIQYAASRYYGDWVPYTVEVEELSRYVDSNGADISRIKVVTVSNGPAQQAVRRHVPELMPGARINWLTLKGED